MIKEFSKKIGIEFKNLDLLEEALTHRSYLNENKNIKKRHNERLEFLGDAVLELVVTDFLFHNYKNAEGDLTSWRAALVNGATLAEVSGGLNVGNYLLMSKGESMDTGRARQYLLANAMEAIIGAIYLDQGYDVVKDFILKNIVVKIDEILEKKLYLDPKSYFQEKAQQFEKITPSYKLIREEGPDHDRIFTVGVYLENKLIAKGKGPSKQVAQRNAAQAGLEIKGWE
ncbi:MAG TPA: ribonuclease III [Candidatus Moranbacteria bacterium]|nr:ribonuclease III [Candidatus Moranbacteria bacterium]